MHHILWEVYLSWTYKCWSSRISLNILIYKTKKKTTKEFNKTNSNNIDRGLFFYLFYVIYVCVLDARIIEINVKFLFFFNLFRAYYLYHHHHYLCIKCISLGLRFAAVCCTKYTMGGIENNSHNHKQMGYALAQRQLLFLLHK